MDKLDRVKALAGIKVVYIGSLWHEFCEPFATVLATTAEAAEAKLIEVANEEAEQTPDETLTSGIFSAATVGLLAYVCESHDLEEVVDSLLETGVFVC